MGVNRLMMGRSRVRGTGGGEEGSYRGRRKAGGRDGQGRRIAGGDPWMRDTRDDDDDDARTSSWKKRRMEAKGAEEGGFVRSELQKAEPERRQAAVEKEFQS